MYTVEETTGLLDRIQTGMRNVIVGQPMMVDLMMAALIADGHILLEGPPGVAKTLAARTLSKLLDISFARIQFTPDLMPADILGTSVFNPKTLEFSYRTGPVFANVVLADEINRAPAKTQAAMFEVMEERQVTQDGIAHPLPLPFMVIATQNPIEHEGTYRLPEAQLDRFQLKLVIDYPSAADELAILTNHHSGTLSTSLSNVFPVVSAGEVVSLRSTVRSVTVEPSVLQYISQITMATRSNAMLYMSASTRASISMLQMSKAMALLRGRDYVIPEDVQDVAKPVMRHRIVVHAEREMEGHTPDSIVDTIIAGIELPR